MSRRHAGGLGERAAPTTDWYAVGADLHREFGDVPPARMAGIVRERHPAIDPEALYQLGVGYARRLARGWGDHATVG